MSSVSTRHQGNCLEILIDGVFDMEIYHDFNNAYKNHLDTTECFIVNLSQTDRIDSAALGLMLLLRQNAGADKSQITLLNPNERVMKSLKTAQFAKLFNIQTQN
jgi:anti-anti-sigma factor